MSKITVSVTLDSGDTYDATLNDVPSDATAEQLADILAPALRLLSDQCFGGRDRIAAEVAEMRALLGLPA